MKTILYVGKDEIECGVVARFLEEREDGHRVMKATGSQGAIAMIDMTPELNTVIVNAELADGKNGVKVLKHLRDLGSRATPCLIYRDGEDAYAKAAEALGAVIIKRPINLLPLCDTLVL